MKIAAALLGACLLLTACNSRTGSPPPAQNPNPITVQTTIPVSPVADPAAVRWMDGFCSAIHGYRERTNREAEPNQPTPNSIAESQKQLSATLGGIAARTGEVVEKLTALPPAPVPLGETVRQGFLAKFTKARDRATEAKAKLDRAKRGNEASQNPAAAAVEQAQADVDGTYDPVGAVTASPELMVASANAPGCKA
ncbi:hypothetical protein [Amycolatopsis rifamycinica]|uniref:Lipoprotein n=1 Tax=Amycolatopsis rifamycinica TaxID=287986 RepID=A0A066U1P4_9PSEU|nr:hypothetical protein [Amycolatopsis rifamycinica]KDN21371.1 hypothetical protein DV20_15895 [Amycolatopsis rifamycinica]